MINNKYGILLIVLAFFTIGCDQKPTVSPLDIELGIYERAVKASDPTTALGAAYRIVLHSPESHKSYYDSIAQLYFNVGNFSGAKLVALSTLNDHSSKQLLEVLAYSSFELGLYEHASTFIQQLMQVDSTNEVVYLYELGTCFYQMGNLETAYNYMKQVTMHEQSRMTKKTFVTDGRMDETYYYVAALNTMGVIFIQEEKIDRAHEILSEVATIDSDFLLGKNNLELVESIIKK